MRVVIAGGGVLGTMHALLALRRGHTVRQLEREAEARGASVRNFGLIWVGGRADGEELAAALRGHELWKGIASEIPEIGWRSCGSMTVLRTEAEFAVAEDAVRLESAAAREFELLDARRVREVNPALRGDFLGGLWCRRDAAVEPRTALVGVRARLLQNPDYTWLPGREVREVRPSAVRDDHGVTHDADLVILCTGASVGGLVRELVPDLPVRRVRLQMMQTAPLTEPVTTAVADGDSFRYYPAYDSTRLTAIQAQQPIAQRYAMQLLMVQRADGGLTIGDTHCYDEPFDFDVEEAPYKHLAGVAQELLGQKLPKIRRRWSGVYAEVVPNSAPDAPSTSASGAGDAIVCRREVEAGVWVVTGPGGRGMTCAPSIAETTLNGAGV
ncbi:MAG: TIGR03364 family FAD-dependent oxidoreductase [Actinomycetota bacterium]|nr:TIGR03364 family FAD-dependent oxidoreductase [Actinomycetota bacterium]